MKSVAVSLLICLATILTSSLYAETAEEMVSACKLISEASVSSGQVELPTDFRSGLCWGAFASIQEIVTWIPAKDSKPLLGVCAPSTSTRTQLIQIFLAYSKLHPEKVNQDFTIVALDALANAFPCSG